MFIQDGACNEACLVQAPLCGGKRESCAELLKLDDVFDMQGQIGYLLAQRLIWRWWFSVYNPF